MTVSGPLITHTAPHEDEDMWLQLFVHHLALSKCTRDSMTIRSPLPLWLRQ